jgi:hypothetical protein
MDTVVCALLENRAKEVCGEKWLLSLHRTSVTRAAAGARVLRLTRMAA